MSVSYDDISKSVVIFFQNALSSYIATINTASVVARLSVPDPSSGKLQTPLCVLRIAESSERTFFNGSQNAPKYSYLNVGCILLGDTFTVVSKMKDIITESLSASHRIPLYTFSGTDIPSSSPFGTMLWNGKVSMELPGEMKFPVREVDSIAFSIRVKIR
jgi:hypothetical protein